MWCDAWASEGRQGAKALVAFKNFSKNVPLPIEKCLENSANGPF